MEPIAYERAKLAPAIPRRGEHTLVTLLTASQTEIVEMDLEGADKSMLLLPNDWPDGSFLTLRLKEVGSSLTFLRWNPGDDKAEKNIRVPGDVSAPILTEMGHRVTFRWAAELKLWTLESANFFTQSIDDAAGGIQAVRVASVDNVEDLGAVSVLDGVSLADNDIVLLKDQSLVSENGLYAYDNGTTSLSRMAGFQGSGSFKGKVIFAFPREGTNANELYYTSNGPGFVLGTDNLSWAYYPDLGIPKITGLQAALDGKAGLTHGGDHSSGGSDPVNHDSLENYDIAQHREINDAGSSTTELFSASKILSLISGVTAGVDYKDPVVTTTEGEGAIILSGDPGVLNGVDIQDGDRIAVVDQGTGGLGTHADNGIWIVNYGGAWSRAEDADTDAEVTNGLTFFVHDPNSEHFREFYMLTTSGAITVGVTSLAFAKLPHIAFGDGSGQAVEGTNPRVPTQDENDALAGSTGTGVSAANPLVDNADTSTSKANNKVPRADGNGLLDPNWLALLSNFNGGNQLVQLDGDSALPNGKIPWAASTETGSGTPPTYLVQSGDYGKTLIVTNALTTYVTIPDGLPTGFWCRVMQGGAGKVVTQGNGTSSVVGVSAQGDDLVATSGSLYSVIEILPTALSDRYVVTGDTSIPPFSNVWSVDFGGYGNDAVATTDGALTAMHGASEMTWGMWVKGSFGGSSGYSSYFWHGGAYYIVQGQLGGSIAGNFRVHFGTVWNAGSFVADVYNNSWNFLTVTLSAQVYQFYINGILKATSGSIGPTSLPSTGFATGAEIGNEGVGKYDLVCFWDKALTTSDIQYLVNNNEGAVSPAVDGVSAYGTYDKSSNLQYLWRMGDNDGGAGLTIAGAIGGVNLSLGGTTLPTFSTDVP